MKNKNNVCLCIMGLFLAVILTNCATTRQKDFNHYNFTLQNTLSIFLVNDGNDYFFCIPVQYIGDYQISRFEFTHGNIIIGDYDILLIRDELNISVYLNETADENGNTVGEFNLIYQESNGIASVSKITEPLATKKESSYMMNQYCIFIEKHLTADELKKIINEYEMGRVNSKMAIWFDITIDGKEQNASGLLDDFELYSGELFADYDWFPVNLDFFRSKYLQE